MLDATALEIGEAFSRTCVSRSQDFRLLESITTTAMEKLKRYPPSRCGDGPATAASSTSARGRKRGTSAALALRDAKYYDFVVKEFQAREGVRREREDRLLTTSLPFWEEQVAADRARREAAQTWFALGEDVRELQLESVRETYMLHQPWTPTTTTTTIAAAAGSTTQGSGASAAAHQAGSASSTVPPARVDTFLSLSSDAGGGGRGASPFATIGWSRFLYLMDDPCDGREDGWHPLSSERLSSAEQKQEQERKAGGQAFSDQQIRKGIGVAVRAARHSLWGGRAKSHSTEDVIVSLLHTLYPCLAAAAAAEGARGDREEGVVGGVWLPTSLQAPLKATTRAALYVTRQCWLELLLLFCHTVLWATIAEGGVGRPVDPDAAAAAATTVYGCVMQRLRSRRVVCRAAAELLRQERNHFDGVLQRAVAVTAQLRASLTQVGEDE